MTGETGIRNLRTGDRIEVVVGETVATGYYVGYCSGATASVRLDGTGAYVHVPLELIRRPA